MEKAIAWCKLANVLEEKIIEANDQCKKQAKAGQKKTQKNTHSWQPTAQKDPLYIFV